MLTLLAAVRINPVDVVFFIVIGALIAISIAIYFLIPVINKKQYREMRDNLNKREIAFNAGKQGDEPAEVTVNLEKPAESKEDE